MKTILAASPALLLAGTLLAAPATAQTMEQPYSEQPITQPYGGMTTQPSPIGETASNPELNQGRLPRGRYLAECKDVRMLQDTLTAFCPRGDGTWQTSQLQHASSCPGGVQNIGGDLICGMGSQTGSTNPAESYGTASGGNYGTTPPAQPGSYGAFGTGPQPMATGAYPRMPSQSYAAPPPVYSAPAPYTYSPYPAYPAPEGGYISPSATRPAQPPY